MHRRVQCTRYLLEEGANIDVEDNKGRRVLAYTLGMFVLLWCFVFNFELFVSIENDYFELTQLLEQHIAARSSRPRPTVSRFVFV